MKSIHSQPSGEKLAIGIKGSGRKGSVEVRGAAEAGGQNLEAGSPCVQACLAYEPKDPLNDERHHRTIRIPSHPPM